ncbi:MAG: hypothetical protein ACQCN6_02890 [Candidatus Bathyarchaeia archaeon]
MGKILKNNLIIAQPKPPIDSQEGIWKNLKGAISPNCPNTPSFPFLVALEINKKSGV